MGKTDTEACFYQMIEELKYSLKQEKLVIFVGAGVSKNSGIPTWGQMVRVFAEKLDYPVDKLSTNEYIRIPQYFYGMDDSIGHREYYETLREILSPDAAPNILNELIARIHPRHIVTTNYDKLMDKVAVDYAIIRQDKDLFRANARNYLIKMHGDMDSLEDIVFKEKDYLQYSETHRLMETFLKSLLIDHVFLFVGYSLNDYNLNTFTSWIDFIAKEMQVKEDMHKNFFLSSSNQAGKQYLHRYYEDKGLQVIDIYDLPAEVDKRGDEIPLEEELGRKTYAVLEMLIK
ncbi:MAG: SIR2 family protein [Bacteroidales bacterium]|nr:SIR2 family protein [Clostridium sp.]MCM1204174.1 SIR2 family protein [Bacteroidales bacterium]